MTYNPNIPQATDIISQSQGQILTNFSQANTAFAVDHTALNVLVDQGFHKQITLSQFLAGPFALSGSRSYIYSTNASAAGTQLNYQPSVANPQVALPLSPKSMARITWNGAAWVTGTGILFNVAAPGTVNAANFDYNFASALANAFYHVHITFERTALGTFNSAEVSTLAVGSFRVELNAAAVSGDAVAIMVY